MEKATPCKKSKQQQETNKSNGEKVIVIKRTLITVKRRVI